MSRCAQYVSLSSLRNILRDAAHGVVLAYVASPRETCGELSCHAFAPGTDKRAHFARGETLGKPGRWESCRARWAPGSTDFV